MATSFRHRVHYTYAEYLAFEETSNVRHEYLDGHIYAMAGGTPEHAALQMAVGAQLYAQLGGTPCRVHSSDLRVRVLATGLATYPDVTVVCGPNELDPEHAQTVLNPSVIVEVMSKSTEDFDRNDKFESYKSIPSLREYVLISYTERAVEVFTRDDKGTWSHRVARDGEVADLTSIGCRLDVRELYDRSHAPA